MGNYIPATDKEQQEMLFDSGYSSFDELFAHIPGEVLLNRELDLPPGKSEMEVKAALASIAAKNKVFAHVFRGAGAYRHYIPSIVKTVVSKEEFVTAYTPYQAEISQGLLQSIFEYQTMICELTGMDASNASLYDGASAAAEGVAMCVDRKKQTALVSAAAHPEVIRTIQTYCRAKGTKFRLIPERDGVTDLTVLKEIADQDTACVYLQQPNYFGILEDAGAAGELVHAVKGKLVLGCNPISLARLKTPAEYGADIAVGEGQPLGMPLSFGGPYLGFMACKAALSRKLPGRIVGQTTDEKGRRAFVLTLQAREQHIRREKAGSNVCSNQALCALTASVYLSAMGQNGLTRVADGCAFGAHYLQQGLAGAGMGLKYQRPFFHEFVTHWEGDVDELMNRLELCGYLGGLPLGNGDILWCVTELNTREEMDHVISLVKEVG